MGGVYYVTCEEYNAMSEGVTLMVNAQLLCVFTKEIMKASKVVGRYWVYVYRDAGDDILVKEYNVNNNRRIVDFYNCVTQRGDPCPNSYSGQRSLTENLIYCRVGWCSNI